MKVHGYHHDFELEMDLNDPLQNLVRIIQPSLNLDLSKAGIYLCGVQEVSQVDSIELTYGARQWRHLVREENKVSL